MKKQFLTLLSLLLIGTCTVNAQNGGGHQTVDQRVQAVMQKIAGFNLDKNKSNQADSVFTQYFTTRQKAMEDMKASGDMDRNAIKTEMEQFSSDRDAKLKQIFTDDQYNNWKQNIEPTLHPQRHGNGQDTPQQ